MYTLTLKHGKFKVKGLVDLNVNVRFATLL